MNMRRTFVLAVVAAGAWASIAGAQIAPQIKSVQVVLEDEPQIAALTQPGGYVLDPGPINGSIGAGNNELIGVHRHTAISGADVLTSISASWWNNVPVGHPAKIAVWQDTGGGIASARLVHLQNVTVLNNSGALNTYTLSAPVSVTGTFYIGFSTISGPGLFAMGVRTVASVPAGTVFTIGRPGAADFQNLGANGITDQAFAQPWFWSLRATGASTGFTYQGKLEQGGQPANGNFDFTLQVFSGAGGGQIASDVNYFNIPVTDGLFTVRVPLDPESMYNQSADPLLQIAVRNAGSGLYTTLQPRQRITQAPSAMVAHIAEQSRGLANFSTAGAPLLVNAGDWGQGPNSYVSGSTLILNSSSSAYVNMLSPNSSETGILFGTPAGGAAQGGVVFNNLDTPGGLQLRTGGNVTRVSINNTGYVGIGRSTPVTGASKLDVETNAPANSYGGMYLTTQAGGWPFYGYSTPTASAWTYLDGTTGVWHISNGGNRLSVSNTGLVGIGTLPSTGGYRLELPNIASPAGQGRANAWVTYSSREYKDNITTLQDPISTIRQLRGVSFDWKAPLADGSRHHDIGFIAEEVGAVLPELVTRTADGNATGLDYGRVVPVAVEAIKQQQTRLETLEAENAQLKARLERLERLLQK